MKAVGNNIIFQYFENKVTEGGLHLLHDVAANESSIVGKVISVGSAVSFVKVGDNIVIPKLMRVPVDLDEGLYVTQEHQVLGIIDG